LMAWIISALLFPCSTWPGKSNARAIMPDEEDLRVMLGKCELEDRDS
jgi:hypothetical protein